VIALLLASLLLPCVAAEPVRLVLGSTDCFVIRDPGGDPSIEARVARVRQVFEEHLNRTPGRFTIRVDGSARQIYLDDEFLIAVTPADALATHHESAATLAPVWRDRLQQAWVENGQPQASRAPATGPRAAGSAVRATRRAAGGDLSPWLLAGTLLAVLGLLAAVLTLGRQLGVLARQSAEWQRETGERLAQTALVPHNASFAVTPELESEIARIAREHSQAAAENTAQQICDSVERVMAGLLDQISRGAHPGPAPEATRSASSILTAGNRPAIAQAPGDANGSAVNGSAVVPESGNGAGENGNIRPDEAETFEPAPADDTLAAADDTPPATEEAAPATEEATPSRPRGRRAGHSVPANGDGATAQEADPSDEKSGAVATERRGPTTLEITAFGKTYAFPMAPERARAVVEAWESGKPVPEAWLHESGITTARLQPLLDRFVLRRQTEKDGATTYLFDPRGTSARFAVRNAP
jgi:hypothetical protein